MFKKWKCWLSLALVCFFMRFFYDPPLRTSVLIHTSEDFVRGQMWILQSNLNAFSWDDVQQIWHTAFKDGLVDFDLSSGWILVLQVGIVVHGFWTWSRTGEAVRHGISGTFCPPPQVLVKQRHGISGTVCPPPLVLVKHSHQLKEIHKVKTVLWKY